MYAVNSERKNNGRNLYPEMMISEMVGENRVSTFLGEPLPIASQPL
jgi:hypothetical protein